MKKSLAQIVILFALLICVVTSSNILTPPKAQAQWVVTDLYNGIVNTLSAVGSGVRTAAQSALGVKTFAIQPMARAILRQILMQLTMSIVQWINTGFQGSPSFVTNPGKFFLNIGDQIAGRFLKADGDLRFLCSPFSLDVRLALAIKMQGGGANDYSCTLSSAIKNSTNAVNNFTISGFIQGDFRQGGWPAFIALTTVPANSPNGAFLKAKNDLEQKISSKLTEKTNQLLQGAGFLSSEKCEYYQVNADGTTDSLSQADYTATNKTNDASNSAGIFKENCVTTTPGSIIAGSLQKALNVPTDELLLAQDIDAIITAAFSQLALKVLKLGLSVFDGSSSSSDGSNYLQQIQGEAAGDFKKIQTKTLQQLDPYVATAQSIKKIADTALGLAMTADNTLNAVAACYTIAINTANTILTSSQYQTANQAGLTFARNQLVAVQQIAASSTAPLVATTTSRDVVVSTTLQGFLDLQTSINSAKNATDLTGPAQTLADITANGQLLTAVDTQLEQNALDGLRAIIDPIQSNANTWLQQCRGFNIQTYPSGTSTPAVIR